MSAPIKILIVDDEPLNVDLLEQELAEQGYQTLAAYNGAEALEMLAAHQPDLVLLDWVMPEMSGIEVLQKMRAEAQWATLPVIMLTARTGAEDKVEGLKAGADHYVTKPIDEAELWATIGAMVRITHLEQEKRVLLHEIEKQTHFEGVIGKSRAMERVFALLAKVVGSDTTILISGETGTGKEIVARSAYREGPRSGQPFVSINCGALSEHLLESELFGHCKGAFTDAINDRAGLFETADGGTLFLDEIDKASLGLQARLLRAIQEGEIRRVGEDQYRRVDVRVIAATNRQLKEEVEAERFREDLFYRLSVFPVHLPPLRERKEDIPELAQHFLVQKQQKDAQAPSVFTGPAMDALGAYDWPGNIRELQNEVERAVLLAAGEESIQLEHLSESIAGSRPAVPGVQRGRLKDVLAQVERDMIIQALKDHGGNRTHTAEELGVSRWGLVQKIKLYEIGN